MGKFDKGFLTGLRTQGKYLGKTKGGFAAGLKGSKRKVKGKWVYSDTRDYRFDPSRFTI